MYTLVLLNFKDNALHLVYIDECLANKLVEEYDNDVESWMTECFADVPIDLCNCQWMLVSGELKTVKHRLESEKVPT